MSALFSRNKKNEPGPDVRVDEFMSKMDKVWNAPPLAPAEINGHKLTYHYNDVKIRADYSVSGNDKSKRKNNVLALGINRGEVLTLSFDTRTVDGGYDSKNVIVSWKKIKLGDMRANRMRDMVREWRSVRLPIFCAMAFPSSGRDFYLEIGFYGKPSKNEKT